MKSYKNHLIDTKSYGYNQSLNYRPIMRSSAAFPLIHKPGKIISLYTFMGYWLKKRTIPLVSVLVTVRNSNGKKINKKSFEVDTVKSFVITSSNLLENSNKKFLGSVELEIFSAIDMVFPYPAITFGLKGKNFLNYVHTCGRIYNDFEDLNSNEEQIVAETGFDLYTGKQYQPFFAFVNGPIPIENQQLKIEYINTSGQKITKKKIIKKINAYGLGWVKLLEKEKLSKNMKNQKLCVKIQHNFKGFFPRFVAGNVYKNFQAVSLTHSYYDTSKDSSKSALWNNPSTKKFYDSVLALPYDLSFSEIELAIYPSFSYAPTNMMFELYSSSGKLVDKFKENKKIANNLTSLSYIKLLKEFAKHKKNLKSGLIKVIFDGNGVVPARMKFGLNFINAKNNSNLPSNVCFNANVPDEKLISKPRSFRWCAIFDANNQKIFLNNTSFVKKGFKDAEIKLELYRQTDSEKLEWKINMPYNSSTEIISVYREKIKKFLKDNIGWISFSCSTPFITGFYVVDYGKGFVGADHLY